MNPHNRTYLTHYLNLPIITSISDLAGHLRLSGSLTAHLVHRSDYYYREFCIAKNSGGFRLISAPSPKIKATQAWILRNILDRVSPSLHASAFRHRRNLTFNVRPHLGNTHFLCLDLEDFFGSISRDKVHSVFSTLGYSPSVSYALTNLCAYKGAIPQGGVTSPALSNIVCMRLDRRIAGYCGMRNIVYTRYSDDITVSSTNPNRLIGAFEFIKKVVVEEGFVLNDRKTRFMGPATRRQVTGLVLGRDHNGQDVYGIGRFKERIIRARIHNLLHRNPGDPDFQSEVSSLNGLLSALRDIDAKRWSRMMKYSAALSTKIGVTNPFEQGQALK